MKLLKKAASIAPVVVLFVGASTVYAATSPALGMASTFGILSSTYTNTVVGTTITGDLGYTTPPAVAPTVNGSTHAADSTYAQAGLDQGTALGALAAEPCTFTFAPGAINLATDTTHGTVGVYNPGVYCIAGAASIGGGGTITLTGGGTYIFGMTGALTTSANSVVATAGGASACDVWWTPIQATTLGATSTFVGNDVDAAGNTIGDTVLWTGRALSFGGTVSTTRDTITVPSGCGASPTPTPTPVTPGVPHTGLGPPQQSILWLSIPALVLVAVSTLYVVRRRA